MNPLTRLIIPGLILLAIFIIGAIGYTQIEHWSLLDAIYMVVITLATVGFREVHDLSPLGRILTIGIILTGVSTAVYAGGQFIEMMVEGHIVGYRRRKKMDKIIKEMENHFIICGFGRVGHQVAAELRAAKIPFVVIDSKPETAAELEPTGTPYLVGDITADNVLTEAGIMRAKGLIASADSDTANVFVTLSARTLNSNLLIVARCSSPEAENKLKKAGADRVISPYFIAGKRLAQMVTKPTAIDFLDTVLYSEHLEMEIREFKIDGYQKIVGKSLGEAQIRQRSGAYVAAIRRSDGTFDLQPLAESKIEHGDIIVAIGAPKQLELLEKVIAS